MVEAPAVPEVEGQEYKAQLDAIQSERDELAATLAALTLRDTVSASDYKRYVQAAAKGMALRDNQSMPESVTTPEAFYQVMAAAALGAVGLRSLLERLERAEQMVESTNDPLQQGRAKAQSVSPRRAPRLSGTRHKLRVISRSKR